ncbi:MAG: hypothetical protein QE263_01855 [Vampirovibrionales bacterium]|nr:hypothetical protein [Vampirovibrionales bacterium]
MHALHSLTPSSVNFGVLKYDSSERRFTIVLDNYRDIFELDGKTYQPSGTFAGLSMQSAYDLAQRIINRETIPNMHAKLMDIVNPRLAPFESTLGQGHRISITDNKEVKNLEVSNDQISFTMPSGLETYEADLVERDRRSVEQSQEKVTRFQWPKWLRF